MLPPTPGGGGSGGGIGPLPGFLPQLSGQNVATLLDGLAGSQRAAIAFDARPGLKFLVQKVCGTERAANLYRQAGAGWTLRAVTLLHLGLAELSAETRPAGAQTHLAALRSLLADACRRYCEMVQERDSRDGSLERAADQPVFFLLAQSDDFPGLVGGQSELPPPPPPPPPAAATGPPPAGPPRPFGFADLARTPDPEPVSEPVPEPELESEQAGERRPGPELDPESESRPELWSSDHEEEGPADSGLADSDDQVYSVVTDRQLSSLIGEYKRRKPTRAMPGVAAAALGRRNPFLSSAARPAEPLPPEIEQQRRSSLMKVS